LTLTPGTRLGPYEITSALGKTIGFLGREYLPSTQQTPALRLSLTPDGKSITFSTSKRTSNLWLIEGLYAVTPP
jgi:hypothetical protein